MLPVAVIALASACGSNAAVGTTETTSSSVSRGSPGLVLGDSCLRSEACESGFCDHPMGFCDATGVCTQRLSCAQWSSLYGRAIHETLGGQCIVRGRTVEVPTACIPRIKFEEALQPRKNSTVEIVPEDQ
jgi:hypothetical protein